MTGSSFVILHTSTRARQIYKIVDLDELDLWIVFFKFHRTFELVIKSKTRHPDKMATIMRLTSLLRPSVPAASRAFAPAARGYHDAVSALAHNLLSVPLPTDDDVLRVIGFTKRRECVRGMSCVDDDVQSDPLHPLTHAGT